MEVLLELPDDEKIIFFPKEVITEAELKKLIESETGLISYTLKLWNDKFKKHIRLHDFTNIQDGSRLLLTDINAENLVTVESAFEQINDDNETPEPSEVNGANEQNNVAPLVDAQVDVDLNLRTERWERGQFQISLEDFDGVVREELQDLINQYNLTGKKAIHFSYKLKTTVHDKLQFYLLKYTSYPTYEHIADVCKTLVDNFPCLGGDSKDLRGYSHWATSMGYRMNYYRRTHITTPEIGVNSGYGKLRCGRRALRPLKGEINFKPAFPVFTTADSMTILKEKILLERNKTEPDREIIRTMMETTFPLRRLEVTETDTTKSMADWKQQWPELCSMEQLKREMWQINLTDFPALMHSFVATVEDSFVQLATSCRTRRLVQAAVAAAAGNNIVLNSSIVSLNLQPQSPYSKENMMLELTYLLKDRQPFLVQSGQEPEGFPLNEGHIKERFGSYSIWIDQKQMTSDIPSLNDACWMLSATYYTYNLKYSLHFKNSLIFLQRVCGVAKSAVAKKVDNLLSQLQVLSA